MDRPRSPTVLPANKQSSPEGVETAPIFGQALARDLATCPLAPSVLLQHVDGLLLCSPSQALSQTHTAILLNFLSSKGHRASQQKAQLTQTSVTYLGLKITLTTKALTTDRLSLL